MSHGRRGSSVAVRSFDGVTTVRGDESSFVAGVGLAVDGGMAQV